MEYGPKQQRSDRIRYRKKKKKKKERKEKEKEKKINGWSEK